ncbi:hypothetical protein TWF569_009481 [Orbilia oligospora]|uniref:RNA polymerase I-specific transcription initiation factor rrn3 n=2 Tax=Orbilia oligospora TaxID=2813651 RepID=A0A7C8N2T2_ORBOL|nr:hypothetical protein TWF103_002922 [Orbilia oligospora]KAF3087460.1 hypothetical protein TWF102_010526 [Orbilia oligospora]KAF3102283.1 hypothetical protein TWF706_005425 [Orbilia oligospora]KAF3136493.1 hypothetical protein TWF569_009481 [Orbilia oligospora]KAF3152986.1 hypothetical protein TWF594_000036 [Orbilia oligospora]
MVTLSAPAPPAMVGRKTLKREASTLEDSDVSMASADDRPAKKVRFTDEDLGEDLRRKIILTALEDQNKNGKSQHFEELRKKFTARLSDPSAPDATELSQTIQCLMLVISQLDKSCASLISDIIHTNWAGRPQAFYRKYMAFLLQIISAHPQHTAKVVQMLVKHLALETVKDAQECGSNVSPRSDIFATVHKMLETILGLAPTVWNSLFTAISAAFPFKGQKKIHQTTFIKNLLAILKYAPAGKAKILGLIFEKMINLDGEIQINLEDLEEGEGEELDRQLKLSLELKNGQNLSDSGIGDDEDDEDDDSDADDDEDDEDPESSEPRTIEMIQETVDKLDAMLALVFGYYDSKLPKRSVAEPAQEDLENFELLLHFFDTIILTTFKSQYIQFVVFWAAQKSPVFMDVFLGMLVERAMDPTKPQVARQAAAAYVASFVARAKFLERDAVRSVVRMLCLWLEKYLKDREVECTSPNVRKFGGFYAVFQAVMYIFCFRWRDLRGKTPLPAGEDESIEDISRSPQSWAPGLQVIDRLLTSRFNPLKVCSQNVVTQFAEVASHFGVFYCYSIIERNKRGNLFSSRGSSTELPEATQLETYFPFDPFKLSHSKIWVEPYYQQWEPVPGMKKDGDEDDDSDDSDDSDESGDEGENGQGDETGDEEGDSEEDESDDE